MFAPQEMQVHLLVVRRPEGLVDDCPAEALRKEQMHGRIHKAWQDIEQVRSGMGK